MKKKATKRDPYQTVTDKIIEALERGVAPWVRPWTNVAGMDRNGESQRPYNGINVLLTMWTSLMMGYESTEWFTFNQVRKLGGHVKKGSHGTMLVFWKPMEIRETDEKTGEMVKKKILIMREFIVFNRDQCNELPPPKEVPGMTEHTRNAAIEEWKLKTGAKINESRRTTRACYSPFSDLIEMPPLRSFRTLEEYYSTLFHEHVHWTGADHRLKRDLMNTFGGEAYAFEELIAELGSAFLCSQFGVDGNLQHPEYIGHWIKKLKDDKRFIFSAASKAREAVEFLTKSQEDEMVEEEAA